MKKKIFQLWIITAKEIYYYYPLKKNLNYWHENTNIKIPGDFPGGRDFPGGAVKNPPANAGDMGSIPGPGRSHMLWSN